VEKLNKKGMAMNKRYISSTLALILACTVPAIFARPFILKNNSSWDIKIMDKQTYKQYANNPDWLDKIGISILSEQSNLLIQKAIIY